MHVYVYDSMAWHDDIDSIQDRHEIDRIIDTDESRGGEGEGGGGKGGKVGWDQDRRREERCRSDERWGEGYI